VSTPPGAPPALDAGVVGTVDERRDLVRRLVEQLRDRRGDDHPDRQTEVAGPTAELFEQLVR
jgi:hypothetical protein